MIKLNKVYSGVYSCSIGENTLTVERMGSGRGFSYELRDPNGHMIAHDGFDELRLKDIKEMISQGYFNYRGADQ